MSPTVILIRHAQALHNYSIHDPPLSELGFGPQCKELSHHLQNNLPLAQQIELIVISPMRRTLQTANQSLNFLMRKGVPVILRADWQENSAKPCDTGSPIAEMRVQWPQHDWNVVDPIYPSKTGVYEFTKEGIEARGVAVRKWLMARPEKVIAVISHAGFLRVGVSYRGYENADFRVFDFAEGDDDEATLVEWELTRNGGGLGKSPDGDMKPGEWTFVGPQKVEEMPKELDTEVTAEVPT